MHRAPVFRELLKRGTSWVWTSWPARIGLADVKPFTLADAMREGSTVTDQAIGAWTNEGETCALSAAMLSVRARGLA